MDKQKHQYQTLPSQTIVICWALIQSLGWGMIYLLITHLDNRMPDAFILAFIGLFSGGVMGVLQHTLIARGANIQLQHWTLFTALGLAIGLGSLAFIEFWDGSPYLFLLPVFLIPSALQWLSIRHHTQSGWLWIIANSIASMIFVMFMTSIGDQGYDFLSAVIPALLQGIASGFVIIWLLRQLPKSKSVSQKRYIEV